MAQVELGFFAGAIGLPFVVEGIALVIPIHSPIIDPLRPVGDGALHVFGDIIRRDDEISQPERTPAFDLTSTDKAANSKNWISPCSTAFFRAPPGMRRKRMWRLAWAAC